MTSIDWSKAPERATHYTARRPTHFACWWRITESDKPEAWVIDDEDGSLCHRTGVVISNENRDLLIPRPVQWDGQGLPPVGVEVEIAPSTPYLNIRYPEGARVKIYANFTDDRGVELAAFVDSAGQVGGVATAKCFRPIPAPEQIAAQEREQATRYMLSEVVLSEGPATNNRGTLAIIEALYDAGYRKVEGGINQRAN